MTFPEYFSSRNKPNGSVEYRQAPELYAVHDLAPTEHPQGEVLRLEDSVAICQRGETLPDDAQRSRTTPVYQVGKDGPVAAPTGALFVRLIDETRLTDLTPKFAQLGFEIVRTSPGKENAGWIATKSRRTDDALQKISDVSSIEGVEVVEPEMLMIRRKKSIL